MNPSVKLHVELTRHDNPTSLSTRFHDRLKYTITCSANGKTAEKLVPQTSTLYNSKKNPGLHILCWSSTVFLGNWNRFGQERVSSRIRRPLSPRTVVRMIFSV